MLFPDPGARIPEEWAMTANRVHPGGTPGPVTGPVEPVVRAVDHVVVRTSTLPTLWALFTEVLGLPVAWPVATYPGFTTGGIHLGNLNLELLDLGDEAATDLYGLVLEPDSLPGVMAELRRRGAEPSEPRDQCGEQEGRPVRLWTNVDLQAFCGSSQLVYLCDYAPWIKGLLHRVGTAGPLGRVGLRGVEEVVLESADPADLQARWQRLLAPARFEADGRCPLGLGPALRIRRGPETRIGELVLRVASLDVARHALDALGLRGLEGPEGLHFDAARSEGLPLRLLGAP